MKTRIFPTLGLAITASLLGSAALAGPISRLTPPSGARFLTNQRFDLRVEATNITAATFQLDNNAVQAATSIDGGGANYRAASISGAGNHTITATILTSDSTTPLTATSTVEVINVSGNRRPVRNVIILLGDGMGAAHRTAARIVKEGVVAGRPQGFLAMEQFPGTGLITTHSLNSIITDSAPGMGCYTTGNHSFNGQEGVYPANQPDFFQFPRVEYMAEYLHRTQDKVTGIVSTADIEDATPAANAVHTGERNAGSGVCDAYFDERANTGLRVLLGGGRRWFLPAGTVGSSRASGVATAGGSNPNAGHGALPTDLVNAWNIAPTGATATDATRNLLGQFQADGFTYVDSRTGLNGAGTPDKLLGLFGYGNMNVALDKLAKQRGTPMPGKPATASDYVVDDYLAPDQPMLPEMTNVALNVLNKNPKGFFLMVEGAHIDKQSHLMDADRAIDETIEFDNAVQVCRDFADRDGNTIVIVLADHECSGFSIIGALAGGISNLQNLPTDRTNNDPTVIPNRQKVVGTYDAAGFPVYPKDANNYPLTFDVDGKLLIGFGASGDRYEGWLTKPLPVIDSLLPSNIKSSLATKGYAGSAVNRGNAPANVTDPFGDARGFFVRGLVTGGQAVHTATDIPISAYSSGTRAYQQFYGVQENTDVFFKLMRAALGGF